MKQPGCLALVLHSHLPYIRHPESTAYIEELWLFEAITEVYVPLLEVFHGLVRDGFAFHVTMSFTPTLLSMLGDDLLQARYQAHLQRMIRLAAWEIEHRRDPALKRLAEMYLDRFTTVLAFYEGCRGNLIPYFRSLQESGHLELITSAATHAFLPLLRTEEAMRAQIHTGIAAYEASFGRRPRGIWLPECGYAPGVDKILRDYGIQYFIVASHGLLRGSPTPPFGTHSPVLTAQGVAAFGRDEAVSRLVWSAADGYPGDPIYREFYRDAGFELDDIRVAQFLHPAGVRHDTGLKYYRITGDGEAKQPYDPAQALARANAHAKHFLSQTRLQATVACANMDRPPIIVAAYDTELFGHWWYEGPAWIAALFRNWDDAQGHPKLVTPSAYLTFAQTWPVCNMSMSSWGRGGYAEVWLCPDNDWVYPQLHAMEQTMGELAASHPHPDPLTNRVLNQAARELMLAQSSDWAFIMSSKTAVQYAQCRTIDHVRRFAELCAMLQTGQVNIGSLEHMEWIDNLFPAIDFTLYNPATSDVRQVIDRGHSSVSANRAQTLMRVVLLAWEYPPNIVGGLGRHVYHLAGALARHGIEVHVVTKTADSELHHEVLDGVFVHRVTVLQPDGGQFIHWALALNIAMIDQCMSLRRAGIQVDVIHAHDWLVAEAAQSLAERWSVPLVSTMHATEHGRNQGIHTAVQAHIHRVEQELVAASGRVIVCSRYMRKEVEEVFSLRPEIIRVIPNGVDAASLCALGAGNNTTPARSVAQATEPLVLFYGRLVPEKGAQILIASAPFVLSHCPATRFVIAGAGPMEEELRALAERVGLAERVRFAGFINDEERNSLLGQATVAVFPSLYEPFGIVALEAMAAGVPVVAADTGGLADLVVHDHTGLKTARGDCQELARQVVRVLNDDQLAHHLASHARAELHRYDWSVIAHRTIGVYKEASHAYLGVDRDGRLTSSFCGKIDADHTAERPD